MSFHFVWVNYRDGQGFLPHMTFERTEEGTEDAQFEIQDLKDQGYRAKFGPEFPKD